jgi:hypothetical protein
MIQPTVEARTRDRKCLASHSGHIALEFATIELVEVHEPWLYGPRILVELEDASLYAESLLNS